MTPQTKLFFDVCAREYALLTWVYCAFQVNNVIIIFRFQLYFDKKSERSSLLPLGLADDVAAKLSDQLATDIQSETDAARIDLLGFREESIHFEQFWHVFLLNPSASI